MVEDNENLFSISADERLRARGRQWSPKRAGRIAELLAEAELLQRGHHVSVPSCDDNGVDLVVDYRYRVQIKSSTQITRNNAVRFTLTSRGKNSSSRYADVDVWLMFSWRERRFYVIPSSALVLPRSNIDITRKYLVWSEAWHVFSDLAVADAA